jgi:hypothetical protein
MDRRAKPDIAVVIFNDHGIRSSSTGADLRGRLRGRSHPVDGLGTAPDPPAEARRFLWHLIDTLVDSRFDR